MLTGSAKVLLLCKCVDAHILGVIGYLKLYMLGPTLEVTLSLRRFKNESQVRNVVFQPFLVHSIFIRRCRVLVKRPCSAPQMFVCARLQSNLQNTFPLILHIYQVRFFKNYCRAPICDYSGLVANRRLKLWYEWSEK